MPQHKLSFHPKDYAKSKPGYKPGKRAKSTVKALDHAKANILCWVAENGIPALDGKLVMIDPAAFAEYVRTQN